VFDSIPRRANHLEPDRGHEPPHNSGGNPRARRAEPPARTLVASPRAGLACSAPPDDKQVLLHPTNVEAGTSAWTVPFNKRWFSRSFGQVLSITRAVTW